MMKCFPVILFCPVVLGLIIISADGASAQNALTQTISTAASGEAIAAFKADPKAWLASVKNSNTLISVQVRDLILAEPSLVKSMVDLAKVSDLTGKYNVGVGLAQAALQFVKNNDAVDSTSIQQQIALANDDDLLKAFNAGSNAIETASLGDPGATAGGGASGFNGATGTTVGTTGIGSSTTALTSTATTGTANTTTAFLTSATVVTPTNFSTTTGSTNSVSPTQ